MKISFILLLYYLILHVNLLIAQTNVRGAVSGTWNISESPYVVEADINVTSDSTLIIKPGVEVRFNGHYKFIINGLIIASGAVDSIIVFTRNMPLEIYNWWGLRFIDADSNSVLNYCKIEYGKTDYSDKDGGGIYCYNSSPSISNCIIKKNHAYGYGGGIYCDISSPTILNNTIANNMSSLAGSIFDAMDGNGGGICCKNSSPLISNNLIIKNKSGFDGNILGGDGGGISILGNSAPLIINNIIKDNRAIDVVSVGGGIYCNGTNVRIINNVIYNNSSSIAGGGIEGDSSTTIKNSILWQNKITNPYIGEILDQISGAISVTYSDIQEGYDGQGNIDADPLFIDAVGGDFHLQAVSPCIDAGDPDTLYYDIDGTRNDMGVYGGPISTGIKKQDKQFYPNRFIVSQNYPNPFNTSTIISYRITHPSEVTIEIFDLKGRKLTTLVNEYKKIGTYEVAWMANTVPSGIYFYKVEVDGISQIRKCSLIK